MSRAVFDYSALEKAGEHAEKTADKLTDYADELERKVSRKLNDYDGPWTGNLSSAYSLVREKRQALADKAEEFNRYGAALKDLAQEARTADTAVRSNISALSQAFALRNGIKISQREYEMALRAVRADNSNVVFRWLSDRGDEFGNWLGKTGDEFAYWYKYEGGKYLISENLKALLKGALAVAGIVAAVATFLAAPAITGGAVLALAAGVFVGVMGVADAATDMAYNGKAYTAAQNGDPAMAARLNDVNDYTDMLRRESNSRLVHNYTYFLDITETAAGIVDLVSGIKGIVAKGYKWAVGSSIDVDVKTLKLGDIKWDSFGSGLKMRGRLLLDDMGTLWNQIRVGDWGEIGSALKTGMSTYLDCIKKPFTEAYTNWQKFDTISDLTGIKQMEAFSNGMKSITFGLKTIDSLASDGIGGYLSGLAWDGFTDSISVGNDDDALTLSDLIKNGSSFADTVKNIWKSVDGISGNDLEQSTRGNGEMAQRLNKAGGMGGR